LVPRTLLSGKEKSFCPKIQQGSDRQAAYAGLVLMQGKVYDLDVPAFLKM